MRDVKPELQPARSPDTWQGNNFYRHLNVIKGNAMIFKYATFLIYSVCSVRESLHDVIQFELRVRNVPRRLLRNYYHLHLLGLFPKKYGNEITHNGSLA